MLVNKKENQILNMTEDKNILINFNNKLIFENNLLKQHINKLIINIDLYINQNHLAVKKINQLEEYIQNNNYKWCINEKIIFDFDNLYPYLSWN